MIFGPGFSRPQAQDFPLRKACGGSEAPSTCLPKYLSSAECFLFGSIQPRSRRGLPSEAPIVLVIFFDLYWNGWDEAKPHPIQVTRDGMRLRLIPARPILFDSGGTPGKGPLDPFLEDLLGFLPT